MSLRPYYHDEQSGITIFHGDCREVLPTLAAGSVDLVLTDPPYGRDYVSNFRVKDPSVAHVIPGDENLEAMRHGLQLCVPLLKYDRHLYYFASADDIIGDACAALPSALTFRRLLCWDKGNHGMGDLECNYGHAWEAIVFASKGKRLLNGKRPSSLLRSFGRGAGSTWVHPTQKPVSLMRFLIERSSMPGEVVLDPFMGSGTSLRAAKDLGRHAIGIETEERYAEIAANRLRQAVLPLHVPA